MEIMTKKYCLILILALGTVFSYAQNNVVPYQVVLQGSYFDPYGTLGGIPRGPIDSPVVYLEDYTLTFEADHPEYILYIKDEDDAVVYSTVVSTTVTEVVLPSTLSGDYEIELIMGDWLFSGWIEL